MSMDHGVVGLLNKSSYLAAALGVTRFKAIIAMNWVTLCSFLTKMFNTPTYATEMRVRP
jgi:hypothetical protein